MSGQGWLQWLWYSAAWHSVLLWPLEAIFRVLVALRRGLYRAGLLPRYAVGAPVIVVGNLTVGGTGKTPIVQWLAAALRARGLATAVVLRGYGGRHRGAPLIVTHDTDPALVGDEALLHARRGGPVIVARDRVAAARAAAAAGAQLVICDDGLQHLRLARQFEIVVVDAARGFGNGHMLPAGPLREPRGRLLSVDWVICTYRAHAELQLASNGASPPARAELRLGQAVNLRSGDRQALAAFRGQLVRAVAGIGHPAAFFDALRAGGLTIEARGFADHASLTAADLDYAGDSTVLMTEKDAVKCAAFARPSWWYVDLEVQVDPPSVARELLARIVDSIGPPRPAGERLG